MGYPWTIYSDTTWIKFCIPTRNFGGDNGTGIKACPKISWCLWWWYRGGKKVDPLLQDVTHSHFSKLLGGPGSFDPQGDLCYFCLLFLSVISVCMTLLVIWLTWIYELCWSLTGLCKSTSHQPSSPLFPWSFMLGSSSFCFLVFNFSCSAKQRGFGKACPSVT